MSSLSDDRPPGLALDRKPAPNKSNEAWNERIARSLQFHIRPLADLEILDECEITDARIVRNHLKITLILPFKIEPRNHKRGDWFGTAKGISDFSKRFADYLRTEFSDENAKRLSNIIHAEYRKFLLRFVGAYRFGGEVNKHFRRLPERKKPGRHVARIDVRDAFFLRSQCEEITGVLRNMKAKIYVWKSKTRNFDDKKCRARILKQYRKIRFPWIHRDSTNIYYDSPSLTDPRTWSASDQGILVSLEIYYRATGQRFSIRKFRTLLSRSS